MHKMCHNRLKSILHLRFYKIFKNEHLSQDFQKMIENAQNAPSHKWSNGILFQKMFCPTMRKQKWSSVTFGTKLEKFSVSKIVK